MKVESVSKVGNKWKLTFDPPLAYSYDRKTVVVYGNVALATHGESVSEILGAGRASEAFQTFWLARSRRTHRAIRTLGCQRSGLRYLICPRISPGGLSRVWTLT